MSKYYMDLSPELVDKVKNKAKEYDIESYGVNIEVIGLSKLNGTIGEVVKGGDLIKTYTEKENLVVIAIPEELWEQVDDETQSIWIDALLEQISCKEDKEGNYKTSIKKPEVQIPIGVLHKYGQKAVEKMELAYVTTQQIKEKKAMEKA